MSFTANPIPGTPQPQATPQSKPLAAGHQRPVSDAMAPPTLGMAAATHLAPPRVDDAGVPIRHVEQQPADLAGQPTSLAAVPSGNPLSALDRPTGPVDVRQLDLSAAAGWGQQGMHASPVGHGIGQPGEHIAPTGYGVAPIVGAVRPSGPVVADVPGDRR